MLPSPDNWGLARWKLRLDAVDVHDDGDCNICLRGDGDWRFWLDTNNGLGEWSKLFDCDGCVRGKETFETMASPLADEARGDWVLVREGVPPALWEEYFGDFALFRVAMPLMQKH